MKKEIKKSPFFAKLLEKQIENSTETKGGDNRKDKTDYSSDMVTMKYPSDGDDDPLELYGWP